MPVDHRQLRNCLGHFATGVTVVTTESAGGGHGTTVSSFAAVSLDPPLVLVSLDRRSTMCRLLQGNPFTVNVLRASQEDLALHFAGKRVVPQVRWAPRNGHLAPRLSEVLGYLACSPWCAYSGGDHMLFLGRVEQYAYYGGDPLLFFRGRFAGLEAAPEDSPWIGSLDSPDAGWLTPVPANH
jgi:flavin reductase (DIM6/NTAB) family NADH-FMN oxidoreductase RutF